jgi:aspartyl-tRNA(Asn)/glutamyl-tRNA(Gln) amidotransferase subunit A
MVNDDLAWTPATTLAAMIRTKKVSPVEVVDAVLARVEKLNPRLNAYVTVLGEEARAQAKAAERTLTRRSARPGPLHGVPYSVKDLVVTKGVRTTFGTPLSRDNVPTEDAPIVARMTAAGGIMIGKTNTPTFGWIGATHNLVFGVTRNPWDLERTPGGSSGGASAAVAAGLAPLAVGTDGGGSIRIPASFAGIFGHKPSYGRIPIHPVSGAWSLSHVGPMTRTVADAALMMNVCAGPDERDQYSLPAERVDYLKAIKGSVTGLRVAYTDDLGFAEAVDPEVRRACARAARAFRELGCRVETVEPRWPSPRDAWMQIFCGGIATRMAPYPRTFFEKYDLLLTPTVACPPFEAAGEGPGLIDGRSVDRYGWIPYTYPFNATGQPACSVPAGFTRDGLPIGLQIVGRRFDDVTVLRAAAGYERVRPWARMQPPLA